MSRPRYRDLKRNLIQFCRLLRANELLLGPGEVADVLRAIETIDIGDREDVRLSIRSIATSKPEDFPIYDALFEYFWGRQMEMEDGRGEDGGPRLGEQQAKQQTKVNLNLDPDKSPDSPPDSEDEESLPVYSPIEVLAQKDFSSFRAEELTEIARATLIVARRLALRPSRRYRPARRGGRIDLRRTMRGAVKFGGTPVLLARKRRKIRKPKLVLICDVSRSMDSYSRFLLQFIYALQNTLGRVESYVFSTSLHRVTNYFRSSDIYDALERIAREVPDWSGGTRIGYSLSIFLEKYLDVLDQRTVVIVLSDGLDTGDPELLEKAMEELQGRSARVIWLNPLLGSSDYRPLARGMASALPHVDLFAPAHNLASLEALGRQLVGRAR
ncbi:MAG TPA: VWA domain-containing protein [Myxococcales bacterium]|nr:VWA domain-containing protein [Myxococcales bacterium]